MWLADVGSGYSADNPMTSAPNATLAYDPLGHQAQVATTCPAATTRFALDGLSVRICVRT